MYDLILNKIITIEALSEILNSDFREKNRLAFTNGCFDILHRGHIHYLSLAKERADILIVGLNSDDSVRRLKGSDRPIQDQQTRAEILASMQFIDYVIIFYDDTPMNLIKEIKPNLLIKGGDYKIEEIVGYSEVSSYGGVVETIPVLEGYSTSALIKRMQ